MPIKTECVDNQCGSLEKMRYSVGMTSNGIIAAIAAWFTIPELFYFLVLNSICEIVFGPYCSPVGCLIRLASPTLSRLNASNTCASQPPQIVLLIQSTMLGLLSTLSIYLSLVATGYYWIPASFIATMWILAGSVGLCPIALGYAFLRPNKI